MDAKGTDHDALPVVVVGAGPVGLVAALSAARRGLSVEVVDQQPRWPARGYAALLHAGSLDLFDELGLGAEILESGKTVDRIAIHAGGERCRTLTLPSAVLAVPQAVVETTVHAALAAARVPIRTLHRASTLEQEDDKVHVRVLRGELVTIGSPAHYSDWAPVDSSVLDADIVVGADGYDSRVRAALGIETVTVGPTESFAMFEFSVAEDPGSEVHLCLTDELCSMMLPLPNRRVRWAFQLSSQLSAAPDVLRLRALLAERAPWFGELPAVLDWSTVTHFERRLARRFGRKRVWLAGDAAHVTSPLGTQSMNVGMCEAHELVSRLVGGRPSKLADLEHYGSERQREWHKLMGVNVSFELLPHAPDWLAAHARRIVPALPASGAELNEILAQLGLELG